MLLSDGRGDKPDGQQANQYQSFYRYHRNDRGFDDGLAAGLFGFAVGAAVTGALGNTSDHVRACQNRYRSYSARTDTFLGYDGSRHLWALSRAAPTIPYIEY